MKHIPSHITVDLDDKDFFQHVDCFFNLFNLHEDNIMCGCTHNITMFKIDKNNIRSPWQLSGENNPWYKHYKYTEKEKNEIITLKKEFDAEKEYMHGMLSNNLIPYENIMTPYTTLTITKDSKVIRDINTTKTYPDVNTHIVYSERNKDELNLDQGDEFTDLSHVVEDVISALINLGYGRSDAFSVVMKIKKEFSENKKNDQFTVSYIIPLALKELSR